MKPVLKVWDLLMILVCILGSLAIAGIFFTYIPERLWKSNSYMLTDDFSVLYMLLGLLLIAFNGRIIFKICTTDDNPTDNPVDDECCPKRYEIKKKTFVEKFDNLFFNIIKIIVGIVDCAAGILFMLEYVSFLALIGKNFFCLFKREYVIQLESMDSINQCMILLAIVAFILLLLGLYAVIVHAMKHFSLDLKKDVKLLTDKCEKFLKQNVNQKSSIQNKKILDLWKDELCYIQQEYSQSLKKIDSAIENITMYFQALETRKKIFAKEKILGFEEYVGNTEDAHDKEIYKWIKSVEKKFNESNPLFIGDKASYEDYDNDKLIDPYDRQDVFIPLYRLPRPHREKRSLDQIFYKTTGYKLGFSLLDRNVIWKKLEKTARYFAKTEFLSWLKQMNGGDEFYENHFWNGVLSGARYNHASDTYEVNCTGDLGKEIYKELCIYLDEPIASLILKPQKVNDVYNEWVSRNFPCGDYDEQNAKRIFNEKIKIGIYNRLNKNIPQKPPSERIEDTSIYKEIYSTIEKSSLLDDSSKKDLLNKLNCISKNESSLEIISKDFFEIAQHIVFPENSIFQSIDCSAKIAEIIRVELSPYVVLEHTYKRIEAIEALKTLKNTLQAQKEGLQTELNKLSDKKDALICSLIKDDAEEDVFLHIESLKEIKKKYIAFLSGKIKIEKDPQLAIRKILMNDKHPQFEEEFFFYR